MTLERNQVGRIGREKPSALAHSHHLVMVTSGPKVCTRNSRPHGDRASGPRPLGSVVGPNGLMCTRLTAESLGTSAAWWRRIARATGASPRFAEPLGQAGDELVAHAADLPEMLALIDRALGPGRERRALEEVMAGLRTADAVIVGTLSPEDANTPGLLPHVADLAPQAFRALRPPRELMVHPAFAQIARRFHYIQMSDREARTLAAGAIDTGTLGRRLQQLQGNDGEFAITSRRSQGLAWADRQWWEIEPLGGRGGDSTTEGVFCAAWVVARHFRHLDARQALAYAQAAATVAMGHEP
jgi:hypothetical protein